MNIELLRSLSQNLIKRPDLYLWLQLYSVNTWNKICFLRNRKGLKISETTITQNLVFDFWQLAIASELPIEIYESKNEKANGNDFEIFVETIKGFISFPCQAKIIQKDNKYSTVTHKQKRSSALQINLLIDYAKEMQGIPIYFFYNYCNDLKFCEQLQEATGYAIENYGISVVKAADLKRDFLFRKANNDIEFKIPYFKDLHPRTGVPVHAFLQNLRDTSIDNWTKKNEIGSIKFYKKEEITNTKSWADLAPLPSIGFIHTEKKKNVFY